MLIRLPEWLALEWCSLDLTTACITVTAHTVNKLNARINYKCVVQVVIFSLYTIHGKNLLHHCLPLGLLWCASITNSFASFVTEKYSNVFHWLGSVRTILSSHAPLFSITAPDYSEFIPAFDLRLNLKFLKFWQIVLTSNMILDLCPTCFLKNVRQSNNYQPRPCACDSLRTRGHTNQLRDCTSDLHKRSFVTRSLNEFV